MDYYCGPEYEIGFGVAIKLTSLFEFGFFFMGRIGTRTLRGSVEHPVYICRAFWCGISRVITEWMNGSRGPRTVAFLSALFRFSRQGGSGYRVASCFIVAHTLPTPSFNKSTPSLPICWQSSLSFSSLTRPLIYATTISLTFLSAVGRDVSGFTQCL